jgi:hypothetical protein
LGLFVNRSPAEFQPEEIRSCRQATHGYYAAWLKANADNHSKGASISNSHLFQIKVPLNTCISYGITLHYLLTHHLLRTTLSFAQDKTSRMRPEIKLMPRKRSRHELGSGASKLCFWSISNG